EERLAVEKEMQKLSQAVEQNPAAVLITDLNGTIQYVNSQFSHLTGYSAEEALGKKSGFLKSGETPETTYAELWETIQRGKVWSGTLRNRRKDGSSYWENNTISAVRNEKGEISHYLAVKEDISPRIEMENALQEAKNVAETANQVKNEFLANITHELRTPLNGITGITHLLMDEDLGFLNKSQKKHLKNLGDCTNQLSGLINDLLDISRLDTDEFTLENRAFHLHEVVAQSVVTMTDQAKMKGLTISNQIDPLTPVEVVGDAFRLRQIMLNLLRNAVKFTEKGSIVLAIGPDDTTSQQAGRLHIQVRDTGIGIPPEKKAAIFDLFTQVNTSANRQFGGSGVGLFIAKRLTELMHGHIWVESVLGEGSVFHVVIPFTLPNQNLSPLLPVPVQVEEDLTGMAVLIAGRNPLNRMILKKLLHNMSLLVSEADDCQRAMENLALTPSPDYRMVFLDCYQWENDQETILRQLSAIPSQQRIPIILVASEGNRSSAPPTTPPGIYILGKPLNRSEAYQTIHVALAYQSSLRPTIYHTAQ
ncbi:MAG: PAS domain S-box protein, partial [Magnetococcales bacterium]|nr:PAS domain S-box protein [Magnetococcales bacterium]